MKWTSSAISFAALSGVFTAPPTFSQSFDYESDQPSSVETRLELDLSLLAFSGDEANLLGDLDLNFFYEDITETGRRYGFVLGGRAERDTGRRGWGGEAGQCPNAQADCPPIALRGYVSGLQAQSPAVDDDSVRTAIMDAYVFIHNGWGEWRLGYGDGAARLDEVGGPFAFRTIRADGGRLDPTGLNAARTENYASGQAPKIVFRSIALGQRSTIGTFRGAVSITPEARDCGVDFCAHGDGPGTVRSAKPKWIAEFGGLYEVERGEHEWAVSLGYAHSEDMTGANGFDRLVSYDLGVSWRRGSWLAGARWLRSNNAVAGDGSYEALSASIGYESGPWMTSFEWAGFSDDLVHADGATWQAGTSWLGEHWLLGLGLQHTVRQNAVLMPGGRTDEDTDSTSFFLEASWRY